MGPEPSESEPRLVLPRTATILPALGGTRISAFRIAAIRGIFTPDIKDLGPILKQRRRDPRPPGAAGADSPDPTARRRHVVPSGCCPG
jgi:hypothetical protein